MHESRKSHWEDVYEAKDATEVSWYQRNPSMSLAMIRAAGLAREQPVIDVGGGASCLVDRLLDDGYADLTVLDIAHEAILQSQARLGDQAGKISWIECDITDFRPQRRYALWHDRAAFHFLTEPADRDRYLASLRSALQAGGHLVLATFGPDGPQRCSGLPICRYDMDKLEAFFGHGFVLRDHGYEEHRTPWGATQQFLCSRWQHEA